MGQKLSTSLIVRKHHEKRWKSCKKEIDGMVVSLKKIIHSSADRTLRCNREEILSTFNNLAEVWTTTAGFLPTIHKQIGKSISLIASSILIQPKAMTRKYVNHNFESQAFIDGVREVAVFLLLSHNITSCSDGVELSISLTFSIYQGSPRLPFWPSVSGDGAVEMSDCDTGSYRRKPSTTSSMEYRVVKNRATTVA